MIIHHVRLAVRAFLKRPAYSFINIFGLGIGLAAFALITLFVRDELSYDRHHQDADRVYRVSFAGYPPNSPPDYFAVTSTPVGPAIRRDFPEVESLVRLVPWSPTILHEDEYYFDDRFWYAEEGLLDVFTLPIVSGSETDQLVRPNTMLLTEAMAIKYFGDADPVGQELTLNDSLQFEITGVIENLPAASHFQGDFFVSYATLLQSQPENNNWLSLGIYTYLKLLPNVDIGQIESRLKEIVHDNFGEQLDQIGFRAELFLEPLTDIYLKSDIGAQIGATGDMTQVWVFSAIALFILMLAIINFTNLATARSMERAREVGVKKALGSSRTTLVQQFLVESTTMSVVSVLIGFVVAAASLRVLNSIADKELSLGMLFSPDLVLILFTSAIVCGILGGLYPAFMLSSFNTIDSLKGVNKSARSGALVRKMLVSAQFAVSIGLIAGTMIVFQQLDFLRSQNLGFDKDQVLVVDTGTLPRSETDGQNETLISQFSELALVEEASLSATVPGRGTGRNLFNAEGLDPEDIRSGETLSIGYDYFENYRISVVAGRTFSRDFETDQSSGIVINEEMVRYLGWGAPEAALGKTIDLGGGPRNVIGVVSDYFHNSLKQQIQPSMFVLSDRANRFLTLRVSARDASKVVSEASALWSTLFPAYPFESFFLDDDFNRQYQAEERLSRVFSIFSVVAIAIACLGLFGLAAFTATQRTKEIGIRKVLGASISSIVRLLSREFSYLVLAGFVIAVPATLYGMAKWLEPFPQKVSIQWWVFVVAGIGTLIIALLTVGYQALKAASADPVASLRYD